MPCSENQPDPRMPGTLWSCIAVTFAEISIGGSIMIIALEHLPAAHGLSSKTTGLRYIRENGGREHVSQRIRL